MTTEQKQTKEPPSAPDAAVAIEDEKVTMPMPAFVLIPVCMALIVNSAALAAVALLWPGQMVNGALGAAACVFGLVVGALSIQPWKPRSHEAWPTIVLASHGISMGAVILAVVSLYSAARPDVPAFLVCVALPFPLAMIAQARLVLGPALGVTGGNGRSAHDTH